MEEELSGATPLSNALAATLVYDDSCECVADGCREPGVQAPEAVAQVAGVCG